LPNLLLNVCFAQGTVYLSENFYVAALFEKIHHLVKAAIDTPNNYIIVHKRIYRYIFWVGCLSVLITTFLPITSELNKIHIGPEAFYIRLDHLLHLLVYFLICMYYLFGVKKRFSLFEKDSLHRFGLIIFLLAVVTEVFQAWVPERTFNVFDPISNMTGVVIGVGEIEMVRRHKDGRIYYA
jgi:VanZ family protein